MNGYLLLEDGTVFEGRAWGKSETIMGELNFYTHMAGYETLFTDPANAGRMMVMTYPIIGSYGLKKEDIAGAAAFPKAIIAKEFSEQPSHYTSEMTISGFMKAKGIFGLSHLDTRKLTRIIRDQGSMKAMLTTMEITAKSLQILQNYKPENHEIPQLPQKQYQFLNHGGGPSRAVGLLDLGSSREVIAQLKAMGINVHYFPYNAKAEDILEKKMGCVIVTHGGGALEAWENTISTAKALLGKVYVYGVGMGALVLAKANGCDIYKLPNGHRGTNYPVLDLKTGRVAITEQNMGYAIVKEALPGNVTVTHINVNDDTADGFQTNQCTGVLFQLNPDHIQKTNNPILASWMERRIPHA